MIRIARPKLRTLALVALPVVAVAITVPAVAMATAGTPSVFKGCLTSDGDLFNVALNPNTDPSCAAVPLVHAAGTLISWNQQGVAGADGTAGTQGTQGVQGLPGAQGLTGIAGPAGAAGKNGVSGFVLRDTVTKAAARTAATYTVKCPTGKVALGGGMSGTSDLVLNGSGPTPDAKGWIVRVTNVAQKGRTMHVYVNCAVAS